MDKSIGFIGTGNMGTAIINGIIKSGIVPAEKIYVNDADRNKLKLMSESTGCMVVENNNELTEKSDIIIIAVKPNIVRSVLEEIKNKFSGNKILISIAVGIPLKMYHEILGNEMKIVRSMPNTPALIGEGMTLISYGSSLSQSDVDEVVSILKCTGKVEALEEKLMSEVTALTGSSPAYVYMFIEAMADAAVQSGIPRALAYRLAAQAVQGSARMVLETEKHPGELKDNVCSPAGTTIEAVAALEKNGFRYAVMDTMNECTKKAREIGKIYG